MKKWIRWGGLIPFVAIVALVAIVWNFFIDGIVERTIEKVGSSVVGAKVELDAADVSLFPLGVELTRLQVTNPRDYMENAIEVRRVAFDMEPLELLRRKVIINEMSMDGMQFGTARATSGDIPRSQKAGVRIKEFTKEKVEELELPSFEIPDVKKILEEEDLETLRLVKDVRGEFETEKEAWKKRIDELPNKETFKQYEARIKKIRGTSGVQGALAAASEVTRIKKEIEADIANIKSAKNDVQGLVGKLQQRVKQAQQAPFNDIQRLRDKYGLSPEGLANLSSRLLGPKVAQLVRDGTYYYQLAAPYLKRGDKADEGPEVVKPLRAKGREVHFKEHNPLPEFLISVAKISFSLSVGDFSGTVKDITNEQPVLGRPLTVGIAATKLKDIEAINVDGTFDHTKPAHPSNSLAFALKSFHARGVALSESKQWPVTLASGLADLAGTGTLSDGKLDFTLTGSLHEADLQTAFTVQNLIAEALADTIKGVRAMNLTAHITGNLEDFDIELQSDLDKILKQAVGSLVTKQMAKFEGLLKEKVMEKVDGPLKDLVGNMGGFDDMLALLNDREKLGQEVLQQALKQATGGSAIPGTKKLPGGLKLPF
ncbi:MAG: TIGR03545 family protein [Chrysiogenetes bacterium]|nr:TIGR03545 family protein [Chrysiogenetes bacterium]